MYSTMFNGLQGCAYGAMMLLLLLLMRRMRQLLLLMLLLLLLVVEVVVVEMVGKRLETWKAAVAVAVAVVGASECHLGLPMSQVQAS